MEDFFFFTYQSKRPETYKYLKGSIPSKYKNSFLKEILHVPRMTPTRKRKYVVSGSVVPLRTVGGVGWGLKYVKNNREKIGRLGHNVNVFLSWETVDYLFYWDTGLSEHRPLPKFSVGRDVDESKGVTP